MLFDSHAHLNDEKLINRMDEVIENAKKNNVAKVVCVGYDYDSSVLAIKLAEKYDSVYASIGIHPSEAKTLSMDLSWIEEHINNSKVVAIGEIGLDYYWDKTFKQEQIELFRNQVMLANKYKKPIIVHMRDATKDTYDIIKEYKSREISGVMHC